MLNFTSWRDIKWAKEWYPYLGEIIQRKVDERNWYSSSVQILRMPPDGKHKALCARDLINKGQTVAVLRGKVSLLTNITLPHCDCNRATETFLYFCIIILPDLIAISKTNSSYGKFLKI